jgi:hypothetical protein
MMSNRVSSPYRELSFVSTEVSGKVSANACIAKNSIDPNHDSRLRVGFHQLGNDVGVEKDHSPKVGGSRIGSRGTSGKLKPPKGLDRALIAVPRCFGPCGS